MISPETDRIVIVVKIYTVIIAKWNGLKINSLKKIESCYFIVYSDNINIKLTIFRINSINAVSVSTYSSLNEFIFTNNEGFLIIR